MYVDVCASIWVYVFVYVGVLPVCVSAFICVCPYESHPSLNGSLSACFYIFLYVLVRQLPAHVWTFVFVRAQTSRISIQTHPYNQLLLNFFSLQGVDQNLP